ncbi:MULTISPECIES: phosphopantetheine-binding protein [Peribacillus]|uniref:Phosphopantetheine-binding protein n=2 Tax=Peribacillus TaxID=2675229 RepID=A0AA90P172_9BACI|nr:MULTISPECIES: phosphopantetheine-binding protein [Peribacillus]MCM3675834.1 phosphopantetheine-binding protein [Peribacillus simplex]MDP1417736.1 phosphopantetheine-binding protein [Peribacillus simplex]MDP1450391.1 phosphopantetheine-binding protein [Peribacillus frigoritolerans]MDQ0880589.1 acyl carrier protein [Peribacillus sp. V2I11]
METTIAVKERLIEEKLIGFWKEILEQETIGADSNFFDLGGNSLLAMQFIQMVKNNMGVRLPIKVMFEQSTIQELSVLIKQLADMNKLS